VGSFAANAGKVKENSRNEELLGWKWLAGLQALSASMFMVFYVDEHRYVM
jgi:hypothetical protein